MRFNENTASFLSALFFFLLFMTASVASAQFPNKSQQPASPLEGIWKVTNMEGASIDIMIGGGGQFQMAVNQQVSKGRFTSTDSTISLNFENGSKQEFSWMRSGDRLTFRSADGQQTFEMRNTAGGPIARRPTSDSTSDSDSSTETDESDETDDSANIEGDWYGQLESGPIKILAKWHLNSDGTYTNSLLTSANGQQDKHKDNGRWSIQGNRVVSKSEVTGEQEAVPFEIVNGNLVFDMSEVFGTKITLYRNTQAVRPVQFDLQRLQQWYADSQR